MTGSTDAEKRDLFAELSRAWSKTNLGDHDSVQIFLMCFDALWPQIIALRSETPAPLEQVSAIRKQAFLDAATLCVSGTDAATMLRMAHGHAAPSLDGNDQSGT